MHVPVQAAIKEGQAARGQLERAESQFESAEATLQEANESYGQLLSQLREKQAELQQAERVVTGLEKGLLR